MPQQTRISNSSNSRRLQSRLSRKVSDVLFPAVGPVTAVLSPVATVGGDGRVSDTQLVSSGGSTWNGTLVGYEENSTGAAKDWKFSPALDVSTLKPTQSVASITFVYHRMFAVPFDVELAFSMNTAVAGIPGIFRPIQPARYGRHVLTRPNMSDGLRPFPASGQMQPDRRHLSIFRHCNFQAGARNLQANPVPVKSLRQESVP